MLNFPYIWNFILHTILCTGKSPTPTLNTAPYNLVIHESEHRLWRMELLRTYGISLESQLFRRRSP